MSKVHLARCATYDLAEVKAALAGGLAELGGLGRFVQPDQRVVLKPNLLRRAAPEAHVTTHPVVVQAVAELVRNVGAEVLIVDSPGGPHSSTYLRSVYRGTGMIEAAQNSGASCGMEMRTAHVPVPDGVAIKSLEVLAPIAEADVVINLPKLKTHGLTLFTGAIKNMYGAIPGVTKVGFHARFQDAASFSQLLVDVYMATKPSLTIMDGIVGMEGDGPSAGEPRPCEVLLFSADGIATDVVAMALAGIDPMRSTPLVVAKERELTSGALADIELTGLPWEQAKLAEPYALPVSATGRGFQPMNLLARLWPTKFLSVYPVANPACVACGTCVRGCPVEAIEIQDGRAQMDLGTCIRCYCCHELCPYDAIDLERNWLARLLLRR
jgi:uncharacterized protein (DUF362 family)/Pyruvate/2-oxoacid:ferredoxin oxidoreductase delta subunit